MRLSGPRASEVVSGLTNVLPAAGVSHAQMTIRGLKFPLTIYRFAAGHSYTGEEVIELHLPGSPLLAKMALEELCSRGARPAEAGEFTARAYFAGRIDLTEAEGIAASIEAQGEAELKAARRLLAGELSRRLSPIIEILAQTLALVEAGIDFSEEDISFLEGEQIRLRLDQTEQLLNRLVQEERQV